MSTWEPASLTVTTTRESTVVAASGDLDNAVAPRLHECLNREILLRPRAVLVELSRVDFCSAGVIGVLLTAHSHARANGIPCVAVSARRAVVRPISALGLDHLVPLHPDRASAEAWLTATAACLRPSPADRSGRSVVSRTSGRG
jgi:anti-anti-sigma factor